MLSKLGVHQKYIKMIHFFYHEQFTIIYRTELRKKVKLEISRVRKGWDLLPHNVLNKFRGGIDMAIRIAIN